VTVHDTPLTVIQNATVYYYYEDRDTDSDRYEGKVELYDERDRLASPTSTWVPREQVGTVMER
jgi:hypothetical protein